jgi:molybdopterin synthase sulfur carrier subunit
MQINLFLEYGLITLASSNNPLVIFFVIKSIIGVKLLAVSQQGKMRVSMRPRISGDRIFLYTSNGNEGCGIPMKIKLKSFAFFRQALGAPEMAYEIPDGATAADLLDDIFRKHPSLESSKGHVVITVNKTAVKLTDEIHDGDEVAILPPVSGG